MHLSIPLNSALPRTQVIFQMSCCVIWMKSLIFLHHWILSGPDISARMLKYTAHSIAPAITIFFNLSLKHGRVLGAWKTSRIIPIPKVPKAMSPDSYRPISLLRILSKTLERRVLSVNYRAGCNLSLSQHSVGIQASRSIISVLLSTATHWFELLDT